MKKTIKIAEKTIGENSKAYLVAEIGLNHNADLNTAKAMIKSAKENGADAVKFQTYLTEKLVITESSAFQLFKNLELTKNDFKLLNGFCHENRITFFSTPFCLECVDWLEEIDVPCYKIASMDSNYYELIAYIANTGKPVILSTGMSSIGQIDKAVNTIMKAGNDRIILLHTISKYPPAAQDMDLHMIERLKSIFNLPIGFSDHYPDNTMAIAARALGACLFEKHFTLDKSMAGPDQTLSLSPNEFKDLRTKLTAIDAALISHHNDRSDLEIQKGARRSLYAAGDLKKGEKLMKNMITVLRPANGLEPEYLPVFLGKTLKKSLNKGELIDFSCI